MAPSFSSGNTAAGSRNGRSLVCQSAPPTLPVAARGDVRLTCDGSSDTFGVKDGGRVFKVEVYLGAGPGRRFALGWR